MYKELQTAALYPFKIYSYNITLFITTILCENDISNRFIIPYAANFLPGISNIVALPEDGQVGRCIGQYIKSMKNTQFCCDRHFVLYILYIITLGCLE